MKEKGLFVLFLIFLLPFLPDDLLCFAAGLTKIKIRKLILVSIIGRLPTFIMISFIGAGMAKGNITLILIILFITLLIAIVAYLKKDKIELEMYNLIHKLKK